MSGFVAPPACPTGTEIAASVDGLHVTERQSAFVEHLRDGHTPPFLSTLYRVGWCAADARGEQHWVEIDVTRDYLAVGTDEDFLRVPLNLTSALQVAGERDMMLPTTRMVDEIYAQATDVFDPRPMPPSPWMRTVDAYLTHRALLSEDGGDKPTDGLRAGHKKDLVLTPKLEDQPTQVAIYGWHRGEGDPIQGLSLWHGVRYTDYSHGIRLVSPIIYVDDEPHDYAQLWADPVLWPLIATEGPWDGVPVGTH